MFSIVQGAFASLVGHVRLRRFIAPETFLPYSVVVRRELLNRPHPAPAGQTQPMMKMQQTRPRLRARTKSGRKCVLPQPSHSHRLCLTESIECVADKRCVRAGGAARRRGGEACGGSKRDARDRASEGRGNRERAEAAGGTAAKGSEEGCTDIEEEGRRCAGCATT
jgi:hypothetical protein